MYNEKRVRFLINEGMACLGMITEVRLKCLLVQSRVRKAKRNQESIEELQAELAERAPQMKRDLAKYSRKLKQIYEELESYGIISEMA
jgi:septin family protein